MALMAPPPTARQFWREQVFIWVWVIVNTLHLWVSHRWPDTLASTVTSYAMSAAFVAWFGYKSWNGYLRRQPYWTSESWRRYLRLVSMPVVALVLLFTELWFFDMKGSRAVFGEAQSALRTIWLLIDLALMAFGAIGIAVAIGWLGKGEPSQQFTRTRWFPFRWRNSQLTPDN